jgi:hypothetical protein
MLGEVDSRLRALTASIDDARQIRIVAYVDGPVKDSDREHIDDIASEVISAMQQPAADDPVTPWAILEEVSVWNIHEAPPVLLDFWAFVHADAVRFLDHFARARKE